MPASSKEIFPAGYVPNKRDERRAEPRFQCSGVAEIRVLEVEEKLKGTLLDLSVSGCCIEGLEPFPAIESPHIEVILSLCGYKLRVAGVVRHVSEENRAGIEFVDVTERKAAQIGELVAELIEMEKRRLELLHQPVY